MKTSNVNEAAREIFESVLALLRRIEKIWRKSMDFIFFIGIPVAMSTFLLDLCNIEINRLASERGDIERAAIGIALKAERLSLNIGIGICLGMTPLVACNYAIKNHERMKDFL